tara:strand:- start:323 stop:526 length:204 start_codon:yes stop_codon:yes gene_type:complete
MKELDPSTISLSTPSKSFAYEKMSRDIENCNDISVLKDALRCYVKLYFKQQETISLIGIPSIESDEG